MHCHDATSSTTLSTTQPALRESYAASAHITASATKDHTASLVATDTLPGSASLTLVHTVAPTATVTLSSCTSLKLTATVNIVIRRLWAATDNRVGYAAIIGSAVAASSFAAVQSGLLSQRIAFVIRSTALQCDTAGQGDVEPGNEDSVDWFSSPTQLELVSNDLASHCGAVVGNHSNCRFHSFSRCDKRNFVCNVDRCPDSVRQSGTFKFVTSLLCASAFCLLLQPTLTSAILPVTSHDVFENVAIACFGTTCIVGLFGVFFQSARSSLGALLCSGRTSSKKNLACRCQ